MVAHLPGFSGKLGRVRRATGTALPCDVENGTPFSRVKNDPRPPNMLLRAVAIYRVRVQAV
jgi:hypothetical protein